MKADIVDDGWAEFTVARLDKIGDLPYKESVTGKIVSETENTVTVEYLVDGEERLIVLEK